LLSDEKLLIAARELAKLGQKGPTLLFLAHIAQPAQTADVREKALSVGFRTVTRWNLSAVLRAAAADGHVAQLKGGWKLLGPGLKTLEGYYQPGAAIVLEARHALNVHVGAISDLNRRRFVEEAMLCLDAKAYRAAAVLAWVGAAYIIQELIVSRHLSAFNGAGQSRFRQKFMPVRSIKDCAKIGEADLLQLCEDASIIDKAEKQELQSRLDLRNRCGHPNSIVFAEHVVASHIETLMLNVYSRY
jgi:hypothetical protein